MRIHGNLSNFANTINERFYPGTRHTPRDRNLGFACFYEREN